MDGLWLMIVDITSLQAAIIEWLARDQDATLIARIPTFIQLAEAKFNRGLFCRHMEQRAVAMTNTTLTEPEFIALPVDFQSMRRIRLSGVAGKPRLEYKSGTELDEYRYMHGNTAGQPLFFTIFSSQIELAPTPDANYAVEMIYRQNVPPLASNASNWIIEHYPDLYLYAALLESAPYIKEDDRIQTWVLGFKTALDSINTLEQTTTFNAGPLTMRPSGVTP